jgi:hypothetical protein
MARTNKTREGPREGQLEDVPTAHHTHIIILTLIPTLSWAGPREPKPGRGGMYCSM